MAPSPLRYLATVSLAVQLGHSAHAGAPEPPRPRRECATDERCRTHLTQATELSRAGHTESALRELREAYALSLDPRVLASIGLAQQKLGRYAQALVDYRQAVATVPPGDPLRQELSLPMAETQAALQAALPAAPKPAPAPSPTAPPGPVSAAASAAAPVQIHNSNSNQLTVQLGMPASTAPESDPRKPRAESVHRWLWPVLGGALASAGVALGLAIALRPLTCAQADACISAGPASSSLTPLSSQ